MPQAGLKTANPLQLDQVLRRPHVLLAEDDDRMRALLASRLRRSGFQVSEARNGTELVERIADLALYPQDDNAVDLIITDVRMPSISGIDALTELRWHDWALPVILITAFGDDELHEEAERLGAAAVFDKPFALDAVIQLALRLTGHEETWH